MRTEKHRCRTAIILTACLCMVCTAAGELAFPGAVGFGVQTPGGHGGRIIRVTNLDSDGPGSLREALEAKGPRIVVFEVGGIIDLDSTTLELSEPFITVAGQTAPSPGISIIRGGMIVEDTHDVVIRHVRIRTGNAGHPKRSGFEPDGLALDNAYNVVVDHCSFAWAVDENLSASGPRHDGPEATSHNVTFSNCIIAEGLNDSSHGKGRHSEGTLIHDYCTNIAVIGNLYAHNVDRNPYFKAFTTGVVANNLIYNPGGSAIKVSWPQGEWRGRPVEPVNARIAVIGNVMIAGANTRENLALVASKGDAYMADNISYKADGNPGPLKSGSVNLLEEKPVWPDNLKPIPAKNVIEHVLANAGARPADRDEVDLRIISEFKARKGRIIDSQDQVGGYPKAEMTRRRLDIPDGDVRGWLARLYSFSLELSEREEQPNGRGFVSIFAGKTLDGWHAAPKECASDWTVRDGAIVGHGSADRLAYLVWKDENLTDFELKLRYRLPGEGNTGVEIRSRPDATGKRPFEGYHADLGHVGIGPHILGAWDFHFARRKEYPCNRGTRLVIDENGKTHSSTIPGALTVADVRPHQWNDVRIIARGNHFQFFVNGKLASEFTDNARRGRLTQGAIGLQIHDKGMQVEFKDIRLKRLAHAP